MSEWVFIPSFSPIRHSFPAQGFFHPAGANSRATWAQLACWIIVLIGGALATELRRPRMHLRTVAPWRSIALIVLSMFPHVWDTRPHFKMKEQQHWLLDPAGGNQLHFPVRGVYRLERRGGDKGSIDVGSIHLDQRRTAAVIEAPPMSVPVRFNGDSGTLYWTVPGEGVYREAVPPDAMTSPIKFAERRWNMLLNHYSWLVFLLALPLYFDWLLGGRRMKEPSETGGEATA
jgi:hypothetical protein